jgi:hypothetical protein
MNSATKAEAADQGTVPSVIHPTQIVEQPAPFADQPEKALTGVAIMYVRLEVLGKILNAGRQQRNLHFGRTGIVRTAPVLGNDIGFLLHVQRHRVNPLEIERGYSTRAACLSTRR